MQNALISVGSCWVFTLKFQTVFKGIPNTNNITNQPVI